MTSDGQVTHIIGAGAANPQWNVQRVKPISAEMERDIVGISEGLVTTLAQHNTLKGEWQGTFWSNNVVTISKHGDFRLAIKGKDKEVDDGEVWLNLQDKTIDLKRWQRWNLPTVNSHYSTYTPPGTFDIIR